MKNIYSSAIFLVLTVFSANYNFEDNFNSDSLQKDKNFGGSDFNFKDQLIDSEVANFSFDDHALQFSSLNKPNYEYSSFSVKADTNCSNSELHLDDSLLKDANIVSNSFNSLPNTLYLPLNNANFYENDRKNYQNASFMDDII